jgi:peptide/nickel transport system permease protein
MEKTYTADQNINLQEKAKSPGRETFERLLQDKVATFSGILLILIITLTLIAPLIAPHDPDKVDLSNRMKPMFTEGHLFGTDQVGRDVLSRLLYGGRISVGIGFLAVAIALVIGVTVGLIAGFFSGWLDSITMRGIDILMAFPYVLLAIAIMAALGPGLLNSMIAVAIVGVPYYARIVRSTTISLREREFILAERALGVSNARILLKHILPNTMSQIIVAATLDVGWMIVAASGLSFLGLGAQPPTAEWGVMLSEGQKYIRTAPMLSILPGIMIFLVVLSLNFLGDGLRDALDPDLRD